MAYRELGVIELREVWRRYSAGDGVRAIARGTCPFRLALPGSHGGTAGGWRVGSPRLGRRERSRRNGFRAHFGTDGAGGREEDPKRGEPTGLRRRRGRYTQREARSYAASRL